MPCEEQLTRTLPAVGIPAFVGIGTVKVGFAPNPALGFALFELGLVFLATGVTGERMTPRVGAFVGRSGRHHYA